MSVIALHSREPIFNTRPLPRRDKNLATAGEFKAKIRKRGWVSHHQLNILGVLYSACWMGASSEAKTVDHSAFISAGVSVTYDDVMAFVNKGWVTRERGESFKWKLTAAGSVSYDILYFAEEDGLYPLDRPTPKSPDEILADRHSRITDPLDPKRPASLGAGESAQYTEILRALSYLVDSQREQQKILKGMVSALNMIIDNQKGTKL